MGEKGRVERFSLKCFYEYCLHSKKVLQYFMCFCTNSASGETHISRFTCSLGTWELSLCVRLIQPVRSNSDFRISRCELATIQSSQEEHNHQEKSNSNLFCQNKSKNSETHSTFLLCNPIWKAIGKKLPILILVHRALTWDYLKLFALLPWVYFPSVHQTIHSDKLFYKFITSRGFVML